MKIVFTASDKILSKVIRWGLDEPCSHVVLVFDNEIAFHSNLSGAHVDWWNGMKNHLRVVDEIDLPMSLEEEESVYQGILKSAYGHSYDYLGFMFFVFRGLMYKFLKVPFPEDNKWKTSGADLCVEVLQYLPQRLGIVTPKNISIISPHKLCLNLKEQLKSRILQ
jgi:hypothetical protein